MTPALILAATLCAGTLAMSDGDSGRVVGCGEFRIPDVDAPEWRTRCGRRIAHDARAALDGLPALIDVSAPVDRYGRHVTSPTLHRWTGGESLRDVVLARGWAVARRWRGRWIDPEPECEE